MNSQFLHVATKYDIVLPFLWTPVSPNSNASQLRSRKNPRCLRCHYEQPALKQLKRLNSPIQAVYKAASREVFRAKIHLRTADNEAHFNGFEVGLNVEPEISFLLSSPKIVSPQDVCAKCVTA